MLRHLELPALLALAGALGTLARYGLAGFVQRICGASFPWGTLVVNAAGCFLFGVMWMLAEDRLVIGSQTRLVVLIGFMGAFTTFSTFAFETNQLFRDSQWTLGLANLAAHNVLGLACIALGFAVGRWL